MKRARTTGSRARKTPRRKLRAVHFHFGLATALLIGLGLFIWVSGQKETAYAGPPAAPTNKIWELKWSDEFSGSSVDTGKWNVQENSNYGASNHEDQCYKAGNVSVSGGVLKIAAQRQTISCGATNPDTGNSTYYFTSGMVTTRAQGGSMKYKFKQGYIEARVKAPKGNPYWPAFWLVGPSDGSTPGWPDYGEFDIFELYGIRPDITNGALHYKCTKGDGHCKTAPTWYNIKTDSSYGGTSTLGTQITSQSAMDAYSGGTSDYQTYGFLWEADKIHWYVNGRMYRYFDGTNLYRIEQNGSQTLETSTSTLGSPAIPFSTVFAYDHSIILNLAVGGDGPRYSYYGYTGYDTSGGYVNGNYVAVDPGVMEVDYVRVYQLADAPVATPPPSNGGGGQEEQTPAPAPSEDSQAATTVESTTGETVTVASDQAVVSGDVVVDPALATNQDVQAEVVKVQYYVNGILELTVDKPPFQFDTTRLPNGLYTLREQVYYKDGTTSEKSAIITVRNASKVTENGVLQDKTILAYAVVLTLVASALFVYQPTRKIILRACKWLWVKIRRR